MYSLTLPTTPQRVASGNIAFVRSGPDHWLAVAEGEAGHRFERTLRQALTGIASVIDQSDGRVVIRVSGAKALNTLAKGVPIDLHPRAFKTGSAVSTIAAHIGIQIWQLDDGPTYEIAMFRGFADSFWHWLMDSAAEFGVRVENSA
jgi:sarcosine oxidase subunit gamma